MTAIIANSGLGLFDATRNSLSETPINLSTIGQSAVGLSFNVATGNLVVRDGEHTRVGQGADSRFGRKKCKSRQALSGQSLTKYKS